MRRSSKSSPPTQSSATPAAVPTTTSGTPRSHHPRDHHRPLRKLSRSSCHGRAPSTNHRSAPDQSAGTLGQHRKPAPCASTQTTSDIQQSRMAARTLLVRDHRRPSTAMWQWTSSAMPPSGPGRLSGGDDSRGYTPVATVGRFGQVAHRRNRLSLGTLRSGWRDLNSRPLDPQIGGLPSGASSRA
jgi:hypothetical protein